ncbi:hypothetical protein ACOMHN_018132 [Nucella lapillus]
MEKRKVLKEIPRMKKIYVNDDLTSLWSKLLHKVKALPAVQRVTTTHDGRIVAFLQPAPGQSTRTPLVIYVENPDDLFQLGVPEVDYRELGLAHLVSAG